MEEVWKFLANSRIYTWICNVMQSLERKITKRIRMNFYNESFKIRSIVDTCFKEEKKNNFLLRAKIKQSRYKSNIKFKIRIWILQYFSCMFIYLSRYCIPVQIHIEINKRWKTFIIYVRDRSSEITNRNYILNPFVANIRFAYSFR